jgi:hypothetical protein
MRTGRKEDKIAEPRVVPLIFSFGTEVEFLVESQHTGVDCFLREPSSRRNKGKGDWGRLVEEDREVVKRESEKKEGKKFKNLHIEAEVS